VLIGLTLLGLAAAARARVPSHFALPQLAVADPAFIPTIEAYTVAPVGGGNTVDVLLNGDQIFPTQLAAIRSARETITCAVFLRGGPHRPRDRGARPARSA
jgi:cardiolipin synthase